MNNKKILEIAIQKAIDGGWLDGESALSQIKGTPYFAIDGLSNNIIFNHNFAKALWGDEPIVEYFGYASKDIRPAYAYHLRQMVISGDAIRYLGGHIMNPNPTTLSVDEQIDVNKRIKDLQSDWADRIDDAYLTDYQVELLTPFIKSLIRQVCEEVIGQNETIPQSETGIDLGIITGKKPRNDLRDEQRTKLNKIMGEK